MAVRTMRKAAVGMLEADHPAVIRPVERMRMAVKATSMAMRVVSAHSWVTMRG
jgi:hypothetical protein